MYLDARDILDRAWAVSAGRGECRVQNKCRVSVYRTDELIRQRKGVID